MIRLLILLTILSYSVFLHADEFRTWTGSNDKKIEAELISFDEQGEIVHIRLKNGKEQRVKLSLFSQKDQDYVKNIGKTDDPFASDDSKPTGPLRIILNITEQGACKYRIEKATEPYKNDFVGEPIHLKLLPKTKSFKAKDGTLKMVYDFSDSDSISDIFSVRNNVALDKKKGTLILNAPGKDEKDIGFANFAIRPFLPVTIVLELVEYEEAHTAILVGSVSGTFTFNHYFQPTQPYFLKVEGNGKQVFQSGPYPPNEALDREFDLPLKKKPNEPFYFNIRQLAINKEIAFSKIILISRMNPIPMVGIKEKEGGLYFAIVDPDGIGYRSGLRVGDTLKSINAKTYRNAADAMSAIMNLELTEKSVIVVEREGKTVRVEIE